MENSSRLSRLVNPAWAALAGIDKGLLVALFLAVAFSAVGINWGRVECWNPDEMALRSIFPKGLWRTFIVDVNGDVGCCCCPKDEPVPANVVPAVNVVVGPTCFPFLPFP